MLVPTITAYPVEPPRPIGQNVSQAAASAAMPQIVPAQEATDRARIAYWTATTVSWVAAATVA